MARYNGRNSIALGQIFSTVDESIALSSLQLVSGEWEDLIYRAKRIERKGW